MKAAPKKVVYILKSDYPAECATGLQTDTVEVAKQYMEDTDKVFTAEYNKLGYDTNIIVVPVQGYKKMLQDMLPPPEEHPIILNTCDLFGVGMEAHTIAAFLDVNDYDYFGCNCEFDIKSTSKVLTKKCLQKFGVSTLDYVAFTKCTPLVKEQIEKAKLPYPLILKPSVSCHCEGIRYPINSYQELEKAVSELKGFRNLYVEEFLQGREFTCFVYDEKGEAKALDPIHSEGQVIITAYKEIKDKALSDKIKDLSVRAYKAIGGKGYGRVDLKERLPSHEIFILEVNSSPTLTSNTITQIARVNHLEVTDIFRLIIS